MSSPVSMCKSPEQIAETIVKIGGKKGTAKFLPNLLKGILAGVMLSFGGCFALTTAGNAPPSVQKLLLGLVFPTGLTLIVLTGMELFTSNCMYMVMALMERKCNIKQLLYNWVCSFIGNFIGSLIVAYFLTDLAELPMTKGNWQVYVTGLAEGKVNNSWGINFLRSIGCNWLVCLAVFISMAADDIGSKIIAVFLPIIAFVTSGFEHSIANMFFIPVGIFIGADCGWGKFLYNNLLPVTLGNIIGGGFFVGFLFWYIHIYSNRSKASTAQIDGSDMFPVTSK